MSTSRFPRKGLLIGGLALLLLLLVAVFFVLGWGRRGQDYMTRPLVLLLRPYSGQRLSVGEGVTVYTTARSSAGIARLELWAEGERIAVREVEGDALSPLALSALWEPRAVGPHVVYVQAVAANGVEGHAAVTVDVVEAAPAFGMHTVVEGESLDTIAIDYGTDKDNLASLNPDLLPEGPAPGHRLRVPLEDTAPEEPAPEAPIAEPSEPPLPDDMADEAVPGAPLSVRLEALSLTTDSAYESVHCYASIGALPPRWYPDADDNQASDESFASLGGTAWDVAAHLSGDAAPSLTWPSDQDLPLEATCVGIRGGGSDAVELGSLSLAVPFRLWDGERRWASSTGGEGAFDLEYRVGPGEIYMLDLDLGMTPPVNLRYDDRRQSLRWDYQPRSQPEPEPRIDGFLIFLNDTLVWEARNDDRESRLPYEWLRPPCGESYVFTVRAFRRPYPSGPYSVPSNAVTLSGGEPGTEACNREFVVTFTTLHTENMGGDGDRDVGDMGPVYGAIYANDSYSEFDGACTDRDPGAGSICVYMGLDHNSSYDLTSFPWEGSFSRNRLLVELAEDENLSVGFTMSDADTGTNNEDDEVCSGRFDYFFNRVASGPVEDTILAGPTGSAETRCRIDFSVAPGPGSPVGVGGGDLPLPWLDLVDLTTDLETGELQIHLRNTGSAAWANHDLKIRVTGHNGTARGFYSWPLFYLDPGASTILTHPSLRPEPAMDVCVELDPDDQVLEQHEYTGALGHGRICAPLPDLTIERAEIDEPGNRLLWTVRNLGEAEVTTLDVDASIEYASGSSVLFPHPMRNPPIIRPGGTSVMEWPLDALDREAMDDSFTLEIDPRRQLFEADEDNNTLWVHGGDHLRVEWLRSRLIWYPTLYGDDCNDYRIRNSQEQTVTFEVYAETPYSSRRVASWSRTEDVGWPGDEVFDYEGLVADFDILGQEQLRIHLSGELRNDDMGTGDVIFTPDETWGSLYASSLASSICRPGDDFHAASMGPPDSDWGVCGNWSVRYTICTAH